MAYYNNSINRILNGTTNTYNPPKTYKNKKPTKEEFRVENLDFTFIEKEYKGYIKKTDMIDTILGIGWFALGGIPCGYISASSTSHFGDDSFIPIIIFFLLYFLGFYLIGFLAKGLQLFLVGKKNKYKTDYENIEKYKNACREYEWWQERKAKEFWFKLDGREFENEIAKIFRRNGYKATVCKQGGDEGIDIELEKNNEREIVQCKAHKSKISPSVARDLCGTMLNSNVKHAYLVTLHGGTSGTIDFCRKNNITIWDIDDIMKYNNN